MSTSDRIAIIGIVVSAVVGLTAWLVKPEVFKGFLKTWGSVLLL